MQIQKFLTVKLLFLILATASTVQAQNWSEIESGILNETNFARTQPAEYIEIRLKPMLTRYQKKGNGSGSYWIYINSLGQQVRSNEGPSAVEEAIQVMMKMTPVKELSNSESLHKVVESFVALQGPTGQTGHTDPSGQDPFERMEAAGQFYGTAGENIAYGLVSAEEYVAGLIVDDGVPSRGHRSNLFNKSFRVVGTACGPHTEYELMCAQDFASSFVPKE